MTFKDLSINFEIDCIVFYFRSVTNKLYSLVTKKQINSTYYFIIRPPYNSYKLNVKFWLSNPHFPFQVIPVKALIHLAFIFGFVSTYVLFSNNTVLREKTIPPDMYHCNSFIQTAVFVILKTCPIVIKNNLSVVFRYTLHCCYSTRNSQVILSILFLHSYRSENEYDSELPITWFFIDVMWLTYRTNI